MAIFFYIWLVVAQTYSCTTALVHKHDALKDAEITVTSWSGCTVNGTINGVAVQLWADGTTCPLRAKIPGKLRIRYDQTCKQIIEATDAAVIPDPMPTPCVSPMPTPTPVVTPQPTPSPSLSPSPSPTHAFMRFTWPSTQAARDSLMISVIAQGYTSCFVTGSNLYCMK